jgi:hypothetical protein
MDWRTISKVYLKRQHVTTYMRQSTTNILYQGNDQSEYQVHSQIINHGMTTKRNR